jgi:hypothetical protein
LPATTVLAALVTYRLLFYLLPLAVGAAVFLRLEAGGLRRSDASSAEWAHTDPGAVCPKSKASPSNGAKHDR